MKALGVVPDLVTVNFAKDVFDMVECVKEVSGDVGSWWAPNGEHLFGAQNVSQCTVTGMLEAMSKEGKGKDAEATKGTDADGSQTGAGAGADTANKSGLSSANKSALSPAWNNLLRNIMAGGAANRVSSVVNGKNVSSTGVVMNNINPSMVLNQAAGGG